ncbi:MAG: imidazole glycerol phosphate synthase subunit HisH [Candidatus Margulisiibacteriota bacterium]
MKNKINIIDCGLGNISSVKNAFEELKCDVKILTRADQAGDDCRYLILPGVGAFGDGMRLLKETGFDKKIKDLVLSGTKLLGICLGMQLLFDKGYEFGENEGLHLISGEVKRMMSDNFGLRLPHIGWNDTTIVRPDDTFMKDIKDRSCFYYVNSYACFPKNEKNVLGYYEYGGKYAGIVRSGNVMGVQFHPEKSQQTGLKLLENYIKA